MITILITIWLNGYNVTIDASEIYNVFTLSECNSILKNIKSELGSDNATCFKGDILYDQLKNT